jgi:MtN3 and saliva related transmembrane protein
MDNKYLGYVAGSLTAFAFIPEVIKIHKSNNTKGLSLQTLMLFFIGQIFWIVYGHIKHQEPVMIFAIITATLYVYLIAKKIELDGIH